MRGRILIVEDEAIVADELVYEVLQLGYEVVGVAASGREAIALADESRPNLVLMDIQLQGAMTGTEAANIIHRETGAAIVFITAFAAVFIRDPSRLVPPGICLTKPFSPIQIRSVLEAVSSTTAVENRNEGMKHN
ncbi:MAG: response regulator [Bryobacteraceae bacterium]